MNTRALQSAFEIAFSPEPGTAEFEKRSDEDLIPLVHARVPDVPRKECLEAIVAVRRLYVHAFAVANRLHAGAYGFEEAGRAAAERELRDAHAWVTEELASAAIGQALFWTAF